MIKFSASQMASFEARFRLQRRQRLLTELKTSRPHLSSEMSDADLLEELDVTIAAGKEIEMTHDEDIVSCAAARLFMRRHACREEVVALVLRALNTPAWSPKKRMDFIWQHVLPHART